MIISLYCEFSDLSQSLLFMHLARYMFNGNFCRIITVCVHNIFSLRKENSCMCSILLHAINEILMCVRTEGSFYVLLMSKWQLLQKAEAQLAYELQAAKIRQRIRNEEIQIEVVERRKQIEVEEQEVQRKERELNATVRLPAEAESYRVQMIAEGKRYILIVLC